MKIDKNFRDLKIERDVWDRYLVLDAEYYLPILINNLFLSANEQVLIIYFVLYSVKKDLIGYLDLPQNDLIKDYFNFCRGFNKFLNEKNVFDFLSFVEKSEFVQNETNLVGLFDFLVESFYEELRQLGKLREYKKDYML